MPSSLHLIYRWRRQLTTYDSYYFGSRDIGRCIFLNIDVIRLVCMIITFIMAWISREVIDMTVLS